MRKEDEEIRLEALLSHLERLLPPTERDAFRHHALQPPPPALRPANASGGGGLTEEQKARIARNKAAALERQRARLQGL